MSDGNAPETPEALALCILAQPIIGYENTRDLIRTRDAALIAQHTAELTARNQELEARTMRAERRAEVECAFAVGKCIKAISEMTGTYFRAYSVPFVRQYQAVDVLEKLSPRQMRSDLEAHLAASAQREASARAEALTEAADEAETMASSSLWTAEAKHALRGLADRLRRQLTSPTPPRVDLVETLGAALEEIDRYSTSIPEYEASPTQQRVMAALRSAGRVWWDERTPPPAHQPAAGTEGSSDG